MRAHPFQLFLERPETLPQPHAERAAAEPAHRVIRDYIGGMTDGFFLRVWEQAMGGGDKNLFSHG
ncbi:MAG: hypothetical protein LAQ30_31645 [Acidobacteriia bacterium]|nr:hypothetical protein [Terriglobia bacterium]